MTYILGEEMTRYTMQLVLDKIISPHVDTTQWEFYDLSCVSRDNTEDKVKQGAEVVVKKPLAIATIVATIAMAGNAWVGRERYR